MATDKGIVPSGKDGVLEGFSSQWDRMLEACGVTTDSGLAKALGIAQGSVSKAKGKQAIPPAWLIQISSEFGISIDWMLYGLGGKKLGEGAAQASADACGPDLILIPKVEARLCAGTNGSMETSSQVQGHYAFRREFLARKGNAQRMVLMTVWGDSMSPVIEDGDTVLVDRGQREIYAGRIYAVSIGEEILVKYVDRSPGGYVLRSACHAYQPMEINFSDESSLVKIIGRVIWWCREAR